MDRKLKYRLIINCPCGEKLDFAKFRQLYTCPKCKRIFKRYYDSWVDGYRFEVIEPEEK